MDTPTLSIKKILLVITVLLVVFIGFFAFQNLRFRVTGTSPSTNNVAAISSYFQINYTKSLSRSGLVMTGTSGAIKSYAVDGRSIVVKLNYPLSVGKHYTITVKSVRSTSGSILTNTIFAFTPKNISYNNLSKAQQQALLNDQDKHQPGSQDPIVSHLPYSTLDFNLNYALAPGQSKLILNAQLNIDQVDINSGLQTAVAAKEQEVIGYIQSLGLDPNNYVIHYSY